MALQQKVQILLTFFNYLFYSLRMERKVIVVSKATHDQVKEFCKKHHLVMSSYVDRLLKDHVNGKNTR